MLTITIPATELFDPKTNEFYKPFEKDQTLVLEHSLLSLHKWEQKWKKPFLNDTSGKTPEETIDYIRCMTISKNVDQNVYNFIPPNMIQKVSDYINDPMTATTFSDANKKSRVRNQTITAEIIYYWMIALNIPVEFEKWHLNSLLTLIEVCSIKSSPNKKKKSKAEILARNKALNEQRRAALHSTG